jgi:hypothetical protein
MILIISYQRDNPEKHPLMPDDYPMSIDNNSDTGMTEEEYNAYIAQFDLNPYYRDIQKIKDLSRYENRALIKDHIIAWMATGNMDRVRQGVWTITQLITLTQDVELKMVLDDVSTLSFELAQSKINSLTNPLITPEIKMEWIMKLQENLY